MKTAVRDRTNPTIPYPRLSDPTTALDAVRAIGERYHDTRAVRVSDIGTSVLGRAIPLITLGDSRDSRSVVIVGGESGTDRFSPAALIRFAVDWAALLEAGASAYGARISRLSAQRTLHLVPMLNPDGYAICKNGLTGIPDAEKLAETCGGSTDNWTYNARGVRLAENFLPAARDREHAGVRPESEPETAALTSFLTMAEAGLLGEVGLLLTLGAGREGLAVSAGSRVPPRAKTIARLISRMTGCAVSEDPDIPRGAADWFVRNTGKPALAASCPFDPDADPAEFSKAYAAWREALFSVGLMV